ncbi:hypothetical protein MIDIC_460021 [Alphaproteobacteria bacterium]
MRYFKEIQSIIGNADPEAKKRLLFDKFKEIRAYAQKQNVKLKLEADSNQFQPVDADNTAAAWVASNLKEALINGGIEKDVWKQFKTDLCDFINSPVLAADVEKKMQSTVGTLVEFGAFDKKNEKTIAEVEQILYKQFALFLCKDYGVKPDWQQLLPESSKDPKLAISAVLTDTAGLHDASWKYDPGYLLAESEIKAIAWQQIAQNLNMSLEEVAHNYYIDTIRTADLKDKEGEAVTTTHVLEALANVQNSKRPSFLGVSSGGHWAVIGIIPDPNDNQKVSLVRMNSIKGNNVELGVATFVANIIKQNAALGITLDPDEILNLSVGQQVSQCCGLAGAENIASIATFCAATRQTPQIAEKSSYSPKALWETFVKNAVNSMYTLFSPFNTAFTTASKRWTAGGARGDYVQKVGEEAFAAIKEIDIKKNPACTSVKLQPPKEIAGNYAKLGENYQKIKEAKDIGESIAIQQALDKEANINLSKEAYEALYQLAKESEKAKSAAKNPGASPLNIIGMYKNIDSLYQAFSGISTVKDVLYNHSDMVGFITNAQDELIKQWSEKTKDQNIIGGDSAIYRLLSIYDEQNFVALLRDKPELKKDVAAVVQDKHLLGLLHPVVACKLLDISQQAELPPPSKGLFASITGGIASYLSSKIWGPIIPAPDQDAFQKEIGAIAKQIAMQAKSAPWTEKGGTLSPSVGGFARK